MTEYLEILKKYNYWEKPPEPPGLARRQYLDKIKTYMGNRLIKVIMGQRRVGKSYLMRQIINQLIQSGINAKNIFYLNMEQIEFARISSASELVKLIDFYKRTMQISGKVYLFLDEVQEIAEWEKCVISYAYDTKEEYEVFVTGSNSNMLSSELGTYLSGRYVAFEVFPFSFTEYTQYYNLKKERSTLIEYLKTGGLPELYHLENSEAKYHYLVALKDSILLNDIIKKYNIKDIALLDSLFGFIIDAVGSQFSANSLVGNLKGNKHTSSFETITNYAAYLCRSLLVHKCEKYDIRGKKRITGNVKYYLNDIAYKQYFSSGFDPGLSRRLENIFYLHFKAAGCQVYVGSLYANEVDFVIEQAQQREYIQVCYMLDNEETVAREFAGLEKIRDSYPKTVISLDDISLGNRKGIRHVPAWEIL